MAWRSLPLSDELIWRAPLPTAERALAESIREKIATLRPICSISCAWMNPLPVTR